MCTMHPTYTMCTMCTVYTPQTMYTLHSGQSKMKIFEKLDTTLGNYTYDHITLIFGSICKKFGFLIVELSNKYPYMCNYFLRLITIAQCEGASDIQRGFSNYLIFVRLFPCRVDPYLVLNKFNYLAFFCPMDRKVSPVQLASNWQPSLKNTLWV